MGEGYQVQGAWQVNEMEKASWITAGKRGWRSGPAQRKKKEKKKRRE